MTIAEMKREIERISRGMYDKLSSREESAVRKLKDEYIVKGGYNRQYLATNARKAEVENYLTALINANYDILGYCL